MCVHTPLDLEVALEVTVWGAVGLSGKVQARRKGEVGNNKKIILNTSVIVPALTVHPEGIALVSRLTRDVFYLW